MTTGEVPGAMSGRPRGRWIWIASAAATTVLFIASVATIAHVRKGARGPLPGTSIQTVTFRQPVKSLDVHDYGGPVEVSAGGPGGAQVTEIVRYNGPQPQVEHSAANGRLTLADPVCNTGRCSVDFRVEVPVATAASLSSDGGPITVAGLAGTTAVNSDGGAVTARSITGQLNAQTGGGSLTADGAAALNAATGGGSFQARGVSGALTAGTGGGPADAEGITGKDATVNTGGGSATLSFDVVPDHVSADAGGGPVTIEVPPGGYALSADSGGGPRLIGVAADPASPHTIDVSSGGGAVSIR